MDLNLRSHASSSGMFWKWCTQTWERQLSFRDISISCRNGSMGILRSSTQANDCSCPWDGITPYNQDRWGTSTWGAAPLRDLVDNKFNRSQKCVHVVKMAGHILSCISKKTARGLGKWFIPLTQHLWDTSQYYAHLGTPQGKGRLTNWRI